MTTAGGGIPYDLRTGGLLPASEGHIARGASPPSVPADAIEAFPERVAWALAESRETGLEHGFLAYAPLEPGMPFHAEPNSVGSCDEIRWHWQERHATIAFSFHTHPGADALCIPSGMDMVGSLVRGDHVMYVATTDGRLTGWQFRKPDHMPADVEHAMRALGDARHLRRGFVSFVYEAFDALRPRILKCVYAARIQEDGRLQRTKPDARFLLKEERERA